MSSSSKRQQTMAKRAREQRVKERRVLKAEKKQAAAEARMANSSDDVPSTPTDEQLPSD
jgi:hypothetical protein